jgi:hypothetical protein
MFTNFSAKSPQPRKALERYAQTIKNCTMKNLLTYQDNRTFIFEKGEDLRKVCNAPNDKSGIYLIHDVTDSKELIYVGCCGHIITNGQISTRKSGGGGICGRIVNGHQFGRMKRWKSIPTQMEVDHILKLEFHWYITFNNEIKYSPIYVESTILQKFFENNGRLSKWNKKF